MHCPKCQKELTKVGNFWVCPEHGQVDEPLSELRPQNEPKSRAESALCIFLSYGHDRHAEDALRIKADLEARGHQVWFDLERLREGRDWEAYIEEGLKACDKVVLLMSPHSVRRRNRIEAASTETLFQDVWA